VLHKGLKPLSKQTQQNSEHMLEHKTTRISGERLKELGLFVQLGEEQVQG